jgi:hypothetical protein
MGRGRYRGMLDLLQAISLMVIVLLFLEFVLEPVIKLRKRLVGRMGGLKFYILFIILLVILDTCLSSSKVPWNDSDVYTYSKLALLIYFLPRQGETVKKKDAHK